MESKRPRGEHLLWLPDDLVKAILVLLPPMEVARARLVCRSWHDLTTDHHFLRASFSRWQACQGHPVAGFFFDGIFRPTSDYAPLDSEADEEAAAGDRYALDISFIPGTQSGMLVRCSCNGLLLLRCQSIYYVCNPLTKKLVPVALPGAGSFSVNLAFDPSKSCHYKIIALSHKNSILVYSSETRSWRLAIHSDHSAGLFHGLRLNRSVFWNGSVVWIVTDFLVRFTIQDERATKMPMPTRKKNWICAYIGESGGHLQMIGYTKKDKLTACFDVLEMQDIKSRWAVLYRIDLSRVKELYPNIEWPTWNTRHHQYKIIDYLALSPIYVIRGTGKTGKHGVLIFSIPGKIMSYNIEDQEISIVKEIASHSSLEEFWYNFHVYSPSLFVL